MEQQQAEKVGLAIQAIACSLGGASVAIAYAGMQVQGSEASSTPHVSLAFSTFFGMVITVVAMFSVIAQPKLAFAKSDKRLYIAVLGIFMILNVSVLDFMLVSNFWSKPWTSAQFSKTSSACFFSSFFLIGIGGLIRMPLLNQDLASKSRSDIVATHK